MVTVSATYSPHKGQSLLCHHFLCHPREAHRDQKQHIRFQWARAWPYPCQYTQSYKRVVLYPNRYPRTLPLTGDTLYKGSMHGTCLQRDGLPAHT